MAKQWKVWKQKYQWSQDRVESLIDDLQNFMFKKENVEINLMPKDNFEIMDRALKIYHSLEAKKLKEKFEALPLKSRKKINKCFWKVKKWVNKNSDSPKKIYKVIKHLKKIEEILKENEAL